MDEDVWTPTEPRGTHPDEEYLRNALAVARSDNEWLSEVSAAQIEEITRLSLETQALTSARNLWRDTAHRLRQTKAEPITLAIDYEALAGALVPYLDERYARQEEHGGQD